MYAVLSVALLYSSSGRGSTLQDRLQQELASVNLNPAMGAPAVPALSPSLISEVGRHTVVFVEGFLNESHQGMPWDDAKTNFSVNMETLSSDFQTPDFIKIAPPSMQAVSDNADWLIDQLNSVYATHHQHPLLIIAHSKGAAETLLAALRHPDLLVNGMIERIVLVQGAIGGSPLAELASETRFLGLSNWAGLRSLRPAAIRALFETERERFTQMETPATQILVNRHVYYVRSSQRPPEVVRRLVPGNYYLSRVAGDNDGAIVTADEQLQGIGQDLGVLDADHADLVAAPALSNSPDAYKRAFTRALFRQLFE